MHRARDWSVSGISANTSELPSSKSCFVDMEFMTYLHPRYLLLLLLVLLIGTTGLVVLLPWYYLLQVTTAENQRRQKLP